MQELHANDPKRIDRYTLLGRLGQGGMGVVYYAKDMFNKRFAVKVIAASHVNNSEARKRFQQEIANAQKVNHPNVAKILDYSIDDDVLWFASEYVEGLNLVEAVQRAGGRLDASIVRKVIDDIAQALQAVHAADIVHRDLKPANVMVNEEGAKLIDFGIAHADDNTDLTATGMIIGTPAYMCPEQLRQAGRPSSAWDMFAFGGLVTYMLTGRPPFGDPLNPHGMPLAIVRDEPKLDSVPYEFLELVKSCLSKNANERPAAHEVHSFLNKHVTVEIPPTLLLPSEVQSAITEHQRQAKTALRVEALAPIPVRRRAGESNTSWERRNSVYRREMDRWQKLEAARRRQARLQAVKQHAAKVVAAVIAVLLLMAGSYTLGYLRLPDEVGSLTKHIPHPIQLPPQKPYGPPSVDLPGATFTAAKGNLSTKDPDMPGSFVSVRTITPGNYQLELEVDVTGFKNHGIAPFTESCVIVRSGKSTITVKPTTYTASNPNNHGERTGTIVYSMAFSGQYTFYAECNQDEEITGVKLGTVSKANLGTVKYRNTIVPVLGTRQKGDDLVVTVIPGGHESTQFCLRSPKLVQRPHTVATASINKIPVSELTFKNTKGGTLFTSCSEKTGKVSFHGNGLKIS